MDIARLNRARVRFGGLALSFGEQKFAQFPAIASRFRSAKYALALVGERSEMDYRSFASLFDAVPPADSILGG